MNLETQKYLYDIVQAATDIFQYTKGLEYENFCDNGIVQAAVERKFEIIGEALNRIKRTDSEILNSIEYYQRIIGLRNIIAHGYDSIDSELLWEIVRKYLPTLLQNSTNLLHE